MITHADLAELKPVQTPFSRAGWIFELKYDGFRALGAQEGGHVRLVSRRGTDLLAAFPEIGESLEALPQLVLDGELVMLDELGRPQFAPLQQRFRMRRQINVAHAARTMPAVLFAFDLLEIRGKDIRRLPLLKRKSMLKTVLKGSERIRYVEHVGEEGEKLHAMAEKLGVEGIVAKPAQSLYYRGGDSGWLKIKTAAGRSIDVERAKWNER